MLGRWQAKAQIADIADPHPNEVKDAAKDRRAAVAEVRFVDAGRPEGRHNESPPPSGGGLEDGRGTQGAINANLLANRFILVGRIAVFHHAERFCFRQVGH